jgi:hypothetical protein
LYEKLVLTYDNAALTDGVGAQLQRIYGIYAISRLLGAGYLHTPIGRVDYQGLAALEAGVIDPAFPDAFNALFHIPSDVGVTSEFHPVTVRDISVDVVQQFADLFDSGGTGRRPILARLALPYGISDRWPDCHEVCTAVSPFASPVLDGRPLRIALHVRRGELLAIDDGRMLPNRYYVNVARAVAGALDRRRIAYRIELWTEVPAGEFVVRPDDRNFNQLRAPVVVNAEMSSLEDFDELPNLVHCINGRTIDCLRGLATADVLVMSRSSFSYVGGVLNRRCVVLYHPFWHGAPSAWIAVDPDGRFDESRFADAVEVLCGRPAT